MEGILGTSSCGVDSKQFESDLANIDMLTSQYRRLVEISNSLDSPIVDGVRLADLDALESLGLIGSVRVAIGYRTILQDLTEVIMSEMSQALQRRNDAMAEFSRKYHVPPASLLCFLDANRHIKIQA